MIAEVRVVVVVDVVMDVPGRRRERESGGDGGGGGSLSGNVLEPVMENPRRGQKQSGKLGELSGLHQLSKRLSSGESYS